VDTAPEFVGQLRGHLKSEPRFSTSTDTSDSDQPHRLSAQSFYYGSQFLLASNE
jgi:hypothetical protein